MRAYLTGGKGFVGHHLERHLVSCGDEVTVTDREVDVCNFDEVAASLAAAQPSAIYHLAGLAHVGDSWGNPTQLLSVNVVGTGVVLAAAREVVPNATVIHEAMAQGQSTLKVGNLTSRRDFTDVRDVVAAYRLLVDHGASGEIYNVCSGRDVEMHDVVQQLLQLAGTSVTLEVDPELLRPVDVPVLRGSADRLKDATGWMPTISLEQTLRDVLANLAAQ